MQMSFFRFYTNRRRLIASGKLNGKSGSGENLMPDLCESALRTLIILNR